MIYCIIEQTNKRRHLKRNGLAGRNKDGAQYLTRTDHQPLDSAKRAALCELMKFDLVGVDCVFEEAC
jgi:hypothetical protein